jgi:hypothetical protein
MVVGLLLPWVKGCTAEQVTGKLPGTEERYSGIEIALTAGRILFGEGDFSNALLVVPALAMPLLPVLFLLSRRYPVITRSFLGALAAYYVFYLAYVRYDLGKSGRALLAGFWVFAAATLLALLGSIAAALDASRQRRRPSIPSEHG